MKVSFVLLVALLGITNNHDTGVNALIQQNPTSSRYHLESTTQISAISTASRPSTQTIRESDNDNQAQQPPPLERIPFVVQQLIGQPSKSDCDSISSLVISVFFQEEAERLPERRSGGSITKPLILAYLKNLQYGDVKGKKFMLGNGINNSMFVARRIVPVVEEDEEDGLSMGGSAWEGLSMEEMMDEDVGGAFGGMIYNQDLLPQSEMGYVTQDILGFVDVTEKNFGLAGMEDEGNTLKKENDGKNDDVDMGESMPPTKRNSATKRSLRPVLTNLSVKPEARCSGVGSALVDACESIVMDKWSRKYFEMVLEVEEENEGAQGFYEKRGYVALFSDPTSRRYDTSGLLLNNVRTTKICYRKDLTLKRAQQGAKRGNGGKNGGFDPGMFFAKVREVFSLD